MSDLLSQLTNRERSLKQSIAWHVLAILNTRKGSVLHLPDYGLPDYTHQNQFAYKKQHFMTALKELIERYEPRIQSLTVNEVMTERSDCILQVQLVATLTCATEICLAALLLSGGELMVMDE